MGGSHSDQFDQKLFADQWEVQKGSSFDGRTIWKNKANPSKRIQQYPIYADTQPALQLQRNLYNLRKNSNQLVSAFYLKETVKAGLCSNSARGRLFLEIIPLKLEALQHIPFPDVIHLYYNSLVGYKKLNSVVGSFRPQHQQIGFNDQGITKVWLSSDFSASSPASKQISEAAMVRNLLQLLQDVTDNHTTPRDNPSILNYIYRNNNQVTFQQALASLKQYANLYNRNEIPKNLACINRVGGFDTISKTLVGTQHQNINLISTLPQPQTSNVITQQPFIINRGSLQQHRPIVISPTIQNQTPQVIHDNRAFNRVSQTTKIQHVNPPINPPMIVNQPIRHVVNQPIQQVVYNQPVTQHKHVQLVQPVQPVQSVALKKVEQPYRQAQTVQIASNITNGSRVNYVASSPITKTVQVPPPVAVQQTVIQSQSKTVRPVLSVTGRQPQISRIPPQVVNTQIVNPPLILNNIANQQSQVRVQSKQTNNQVTQQINKITRIEGLTIIPKNEQSQQIIQSHQQIQQVTSHQSHQAQLIEQTKIFENQLNLKNKNFIDSNTINIGTQKSLSNQFQSFENKRNEFDMKLDFQQPSSKYNITIQDGKSSQALLAELKGFSSRKQISNYDGNNYEFNSYNQNSYSPNKQANITNYNLSSNENNNDMQSFFNKYAQGKSLQDHLQMKYSMTKNLYDEPEVDTYKFQSIQYHKNYDRQFDNHHQFNHDLKQYHQEGQYHVDYDPQILADIQKLKG